ncbi:MAG: heavy metal translocating P-type ATPase [Planctomycetota bacterium]|nr:heavy metal translocating P-type ATPase [Planctomycetota bacterium]
MLAATLLVLAMLGWPLAREAVRQARAGRVTMEALFLLCVLGTFALSCRSMASGAGPVYFDVVCVLLIVYAVGRAVATGSRRKALASLEGWTARFATARRVASPETAEEARVPAADIRPGEFVRVLPGEFVPVDGVIERGGAFVRETPFSGETVPVRRGVGERIAAGVVCEDGYLVVKATAPGAERRVDALARELGRLRARPSALLRESDRFVRRFLPVVLLAACGTFLYWSQAADAQTALFHALAVLLVACPCAAGLAAPLALWRTMGELARRGLLLRGGDAVEKLAEADGVVFDKTGTLGREDLELAVTEWFGDARQQAEARAIVAAVERCAAHPVARLLRDLDLPPGAPAVEVLNVATLPGRGVQAEVRVGGQARRTLRLVGGRGAQDGSFRIDVELDGRPAGYATFRERLREGTETCIERLKRAGLNVRIMTGSTAEAARAVAHLAPVEAGLSPERKLELIHELRGGAPGFRRPVFVGDGFNDAAAMAASHAGLALARGSAVTLEAADGALLGADLNVLPEAFASARRAVRLVRSNLRWAACYNLLGIALAATGHLHPVVAALLMAVSSALVSWRTFHATARAEGDSESPRRDLTPEPAEALPGGARVRWFGGLHLACIAGQAAILALLANLDAPAALALCGAALALGWALLEFWPRFPAWADMTFGMLTVGGLGMAFGWWVDLDFGPAIAGCACHARAGLPELLGSWMNGLMLLLGVPAMFWLRHTSVPFEWRRFCCAGMLLIGVPAMVFGMRAGGQVSSLFTESVPLALRVLSDHILMLAGMAAGMLLPHALEVLSGNLGRRTAQIESDMPI